MAVKSQVATAIPTIAQTVLIQLHQLADPVQAAHAQRFFKTGPGQYGEGDRFLGIRVPPLRQLVPTCRQLALSVVGEVLRSPWHEARLLALLVLVDRFTRGDQPQREAVFAAYMDHLDRINNWDLVDCSAPQIVGGHLVDRDRSLLRSLAVADSLWQRRIAILATFWFIKRHDFTDCLAIATLLLHDSHDLLYKAVGWMLREVGKRDRTVAEAFLKRHGPVMPRTMLRYAIERYPEPLRQIYLGIKKSQPIASIP